MGAPLPPNPRDSEIELTERVATRLFRWANWYIAVMSTVVVILIATFGFFGWTSFKDFKESINEFNRNVKPQIQQAKQDAQDANRDAAAAKKQIKETTDDANTQLTRVKNANNTIAQLEADVKQLKERVKALQNAVGNPPQSASSAPAQRCEAVEVHVQLPATLNKNEPRTFFDFPEQEVGTTSRAMVLGASCLTPNAVANLQFTLQGPFYFGDGNQEFKGSASPAVFHFNIVFKPTKVGVASGTLKISSPDGVKITTQDFGNPVTLKGVGKD